MGAGHPGYSAALQMSAETPSHKRIPVPPSFIHLLMHIKLVLPYWVWYNPGRAPLVILMEKGNERKGGVGGIAHLLNHDTQRLTAFRWHGVEVSPPNGACSFAI